MKKFLDEIFGRFMTSKYLYNRPYVISSFSKDRRSYTYNLYDIKPLDEVHLYRKFMILESIIISGGKVYSSSVVKPMMREIGLKDLEEEIDRIFERVVFSGL